jgi:hypothetical protein
MARLIYVCAAYRGDMDKNIDLAKKYSKVVYENGHLPLTVHLFLNSAIGLNDGQHREEIMKVCCQYILLCDEVWVFRVGGHVSEGMKHEIDYATSINKKIKYVGEDLAKWAE